MMMMMINMIMMTMMILDIDAEQLFETKVILIENQSVHPRTNNECQKTPDNQL